jgi:serine/threonine-protein kinase
VFEHNLERALIGETLGHYRVLEKLGEGGMGEVYLAEDTTLDRRVALKVLPAELTASSEQLARFEREARVLAAVSHPNIAAIYSFEAAGLRAGRPDGEGAVQTVHFLVMQLAEGETLTQRISRGPIPVEEALGIAFQIAVAFESAHEKGIIHRDLKPANVIVDASNHVKVLDFGLAKALEPLERTMGLDLDETLSLGSESPTITAEVTQEGTILGTIGYMSPEQARGTPADRRSDIWAFGCLLYEMLTGDRAFGGQTNSDRFARILERDPDWSELPEATPASIRILIRRCLAKDPKKRLHNMADVRLELEEVPEIEASTGPVLENTPVWRRVMPWVAAAMGVGLGVWALVQPGEPAPLRAITRFAEPSPRLAVIEGLSSPQLAISPDGSMLAYVTGDTEFGQLYLRRLDSTEPVRVEGAEEVASPFFSPDGAWVGFKDYFGLKRVSVDGGKLWTICDAETSLGATWGPDGSVVYGEELSFGLWRVPWDGGEPRRLTTVDRDSGEYMHMNPQFLPGGESVLFSVVTDHGPIKAVAVLELDTGQRTDLIRDIQGQAQYLRSGHLAYGVDGSLMVVPVDLEDRAVTGRPIAVLDGLIMYTQIMRGLAHFSVADNGTLVYVSGPLLAAGARLVRADRTGNTTQLGEVAERYNGPRFSPDGQRLAVAAQLGGEMTQVWVRDLLRETFTRLTFEGSNWWPVWSPDGSRVAFPTRKDQETDVNVAWIAADGSGAPEQLTDGELNEQPTSWTPSGQTLIYHRNDHPDSGWDVMAQDIGEDHEPRVLLGSRFHELLAAVSPDGRWLAYSSTESGRVEVYVRPYPGLEEKWQISNGGGVEPVWSADGRELFYRDEDGGAVWAVPITAEPEFSPGRAELLFEGTFARTPWFGRNYDVAPDSQSFALVESVLPEDVDTQLQVVLNWFDELEEFVPLNTPVVSVTRNDSL